MVEISIKTTYQQSSNKKFVKIDTDYDRTMDLFIDQTTSVGPGGNQKIEQKEHQITKLKN